ncbi:hypothetical protein IFM89_000481 [Coptis chinensis]|uniref:Uncharacterized protein n=1 Tax=Coptis chinensis TaxID=261450 RepID=A0A835LKS0_9MAGN|nr:hypothetical protein IFM89_000481 [Coptis chinensis]
MAIFSLIFLNRCSTSEIDANLMNSSETPRPTSKVDAKLLKPMPIYREPTDFCGSWSLNSYELPSEVVSVGIAKILDSLEKKKMLTGGEHLEGAPILAEMMPARFGNYFATKRIQDAVGSLIKLVYFSRHEDRATDDRKKSCFKERVEVFNGGRSYPILGGRLHFVKFETMEINECLDYIYSKQLHRGGFDPLGWSSEGQVNENAIVKATGGGAHKFAELFKERLGVSIEKRR